MSQNYNAVIISAKDHNDANGTKEGSWHDIVLPMLVIVLVAAIAYVVWLILPYLKKALSSTPERLEQDTADGIPGKPAHTHAPKLNLNDQSNQPKPKSSGLSLDSVSGPAPKPTMPKPSTATPSPAPAQAESQPPAPVSVGPGNFEKALAHAGQHMDTLLAQTHELTRQLKLSEKAKTDATVELHKATAELKSQIDTKDAQITKLENLLDRKSTFPSLRALTEVKKLCLDMIGTQKPLGHDELIAWVAGAIDNQLANLDVQMIDFAAGTLLDNIPGEQVDTAPRHESTEDPTKNNRVARQLRPCYYLERDSKRIIVAKGMVVLFKYTPATNPPESSPSNPTS